MEPLEKLEIIIKSTIAQKKKERKNGEGKHSNLYIEGWDHEIDMLSVVLCDINSIRRNVPSMSDEMVLKDVRLSMMACGCLLQGVRVFLRTAGSTLQPQTRPTT